MAILTPLLLLFKNSKSVRRSLTPGLVSSILLSFVFVLVRKARPICRYLPSEEPQECSFDWREIEMMMFFLCFLVLKNRTAISIQQMVTTTLMYSKLANVVLFYRLDPKFGLIYSIACFVRVWLFPDNFVEGPEEITYFSDKTLENALTDDKRVTWVVEFYATWSPPCHAAMPAFAALSNEYACGFLRFGKLDVGKYPDAAAKYGISASALSRQLPTVVVFEEGKATDWRPMIGPNKKFIKYVFSEENMKRDFGMNKLYKAAMDRSKSARKSSKKDQ